MSVHELCQALKDRRVRLTASAPRLVQGRNEPEEKIVAGPEPPTGPQFSSLPEVVGGESSSSSSPPGHHQPSHYGSPYSMTVSPITPASTGYSAAAGLGMSPFRPQTTGATSILANEAAVADGRPPTDLYANDSSNPEPPKPAFTSSQMPWSPGSAYAQLNPITSQPPPPYAPPGEGSGFGGFGGSSGVGGMASGRPSTSYSSHSLSQQPSPYDPLGPGGSGHAPPVPPLPTAYPGGNNTYSPPAPPTATPHYGQHGGSGGMAQAPYAPGGMAAAYRRRRKRRIKLVLCVCLFGMLFAIALIVGLFVGVIKARWNADRNGNGPGGGPPPVNGGPPPGSGDP